MKYLFLLLVLSLLQACSSTASDVRSMLADVEREQHLSAKLFIDGSRIQRSSQADGRIFKLHQSSAEVNRLISNIAGHYGFQLVANDEATYILKVESALPDGGECIEGLETATKGLSYTASILTFGITPASSAYCYIVSASLYSVQAGEQYLVGKFTSNEGRVDVYAGANEIDIYQRVVTRHDEERALEVSIGDLFAKMSDEVAFQ